MTGADARTSGVHQKAYLQRRIVLELFYWRGPGDGRDEQDWTKDAGEATAMDYLEADRMAKELRAGSAHYYAALAQGDRPGSGHSFFSQTHHDHDAEAEATLPLPRSKPVSTADALKRWEDEHDN